MSRSLAFCGVARPHFVGQMSSRATRGPVLPGKWLPAMREASFYRSKCRFARLRSPIYRSKCLPAQREAPFCRANGSPRRARPHLPEQMPFREVAKPHLPE